MKKRATATMDTALLRDTDRCVKCALCLPDCPTYQRQREEGESPRGRVALVQAMASGLLEPAAARAHLDSCLACRACEQVCPAGVPYGSILDRGRALVRAHTPRHADRAYARLLDSPWALRVLAWLHRLAWRLPALRRLGWLRRAGPPPRRDALPAPQTAVRGRIALLRGCVSAAFDANARDALVALLRTCGYAVRPVDGCCGAVSAHGGDLAGARRLAARLGGVIADGAADAIVHPASGCAAAVRDWGALCDDSAARAAASKVVDPFVLLVEAGLARRLAGTPPATRHVALHVPCTQRNVLAGGPALEALVRAVPGTRITALAGLGCCGAAGTHMLNDPDAARDYGRRLLAPLAGSPDADVLLSANVGCAWHLRDVLGAGGRELPVRHPAEWLAARLVETVGRAHAN